MVGRIDGCKLGCEIGVEQLVDRSVTGKVAMMVLLSDAY